MEINDKLIDTVKAAIDLDMEWYEVVSEVRYLEGCGLRIAINLADAALGVLRERKDVKAISYPRELG